MAQTLLAGAILVATLALVLARPKGIGEAWWAVLGGGLTLVLGLVSPGQAWGILLETEDALVLLVGMMALSAVAEKAGFFGWAASAPSADCSGNPARSRRRSVRQRPGARPTLLNDDFPQIIPSSRVQVWRRPRLYVRDVQADLH